MWIIHLCVKLQYIYLHCYLCNFQTCGRSFSLLAPQFRVLPSFACFLLSLLAPVNSLCTVPSLPPCQQANGVGRWPPLSRAFLPPPPQPSAEAKVRGETERERREGGKSGWPSPLLHSAGWKLPAISVRKREVASWHRGEEGEGCLSTLFVEKVFVSSFFLGGGGGGGGSGKDSSP